MSLAGKRVLLTGATGFVGAAIARALLGANAEVRTLVRRGSNTENIDALDVERVEGDLREPATLEAALAGCRSLIHAAADYRLWARDPEELYRSNVSGTAAIMDAALERGVERVVYTSSVATLAVAGDGSVADEDCHAGLEEMVGHYKRSKWLAEQEVRSRVERNGLPAVIVNPSTPLGPGDVKPTPTGRIVLDAVRGRMPAYVDTGLNIVHVDDVAQGHLQAHDRGEPGRRYILGGENMTLREILTQVGALIGRRPPRWRLPHGAVMPVAYLSELGARLTGRTPRVTLEAVRMSRKHMFFSSARAERELGYAPRPASQAIADAVTWFQCRGERQ